MSKPRFPEFGRRFSEFLAQRPALRGGVYRWWRDEMKGLDETQLRRWKRGAHLPSEENWQLFKDALRRRVGPSDQTCEADLGEIESLLRRLWTARDQLRIDSQKDEGQPSAVRESLHIDTVVEHDGSRLNLEIPLLELNETNRFHFSARRIPFSGRDAELQRLGTFLDDSRPILWWLVEGPAGSGKSRLALELCQKRRDGWNTGFLPAWQNLEAVSMRSRLPTLIVVDYARVRAKEIRDCLLRCAHEQPWNAMRIRVLLLERDHVGAWWDDFVAAGRMQHTLDAIRFDQPLRLRDMPPEVLWEQARLVGDRCGNVGLEKNSFLKTLRKLDSRGTPLLAQIAAETVGTEATHGKRAELLREVLRRDDLLFWQPAGVTDRDKNLAAFATMAPGASLEAVLGHPLLTGLVPTPEEFDSRRYSVIVGRVTTDVLHPLEPDLLGEFFVLEQFRPRHGADQERLSKVRRAAVEFSGFFQFMLRTTRDFQDDVVVRRLSEPEDPNGRLLTAWLIYRESTREDSFPKRLAKYTTLEAMATAHSTERGLLRPLAEMMVHIAHMAFTATMQKGCGRSQTSSSLPRLERLLERVSQEDDREVWQACSKSALYLLNAFSNLRQSDDMLRMLSFLQQAYRLWPDDAYVQEMTVRGAHDAVRFFVGADDPATKAPANATATFGWISTVVKANPERPILRHLLAESTTDVIKVWGHDHVADSLDAIRRLISLSDTYVDDSVLAEWTAKALVNGIAFAELETQWTLFGHVKALHARWRANAALLDQRICALNNILNSLQSPLVLTCQRAETELLDVLDLDTDHGEVSKHLVAAFTALVSSYVRANSSSATREAHRRVSKVVGAPTSEHRRTILGMTESALCYVAVQDDDRDTAEACYQRIELLADAHSSEVGLRQFQIGSGADLLRLYRRHDDVGAFGTLAVALLQHVSAMGVDRLEPGPRSALVTALEDVDFLNVDNIK